MDIYPCPPLRFSVTSIGSRLTKLDSDYNIRQVFLIVSLTILYCALIFKSLHAEGDLAKWSARDIHDIAGHHLPGVDLVVLVVNQVVVRIVRGEGDLIALIQVERARLERLLSRSPPLLANPAPRRFLPSSPPVPAGGGAAPPSSGAPAAPTRDARSARPRLYVRLRASHARNWIVAPLRISISRRGPRLFHSASATQPSPKSTG